MRLIMVFAVLLVASAGWAQEITYSDASSEACSQEAVSDGERADCIGASARQCIEATSLGNRRLIGALCLMSETKYWQRRLDDMRDVLARSFKASDIGLGTDGLTAFPKGEALALMMQDWERYRDQTCQFEMALSGAMPGDGLIDVECNLRLTGAQALYLEQQPVGGF